MPFGKSSKRKHSKYGPTKVVSPTVTQHERSLSPLSNSDGPPRPKSLKIEPDDSISTTVCDLSTPPISNVSKSCESSKPTSDMNTSLNSLPQSLHNILSRLVNQASTPSPLTPNKVFNPKNISEEQIQIGMKFDDILSSLLHQAQQPQNLSSTPSTSIDTSTQQNNSVLSINPSNFAANLAASLNNNSTLNLINAITQASQPSTSNTNPMQVTIPIQTVFNPQNISNPLSAMLQSQLLIQQPQVQQQSGASSTTLNLITGTAPNGNGAVTLQPIICNNPTINGIPLLLSVTDPNSTNSQSLRPGGNAGSSLIQPATSHLQISSISQTSQQKQLPHQATTQLLASAANTGKSSNSIYETISIPQSSLGTFDGRSSITIVGTSQQKQDILPALNRGQQMINSASMINGQLSRVAPAPVGASHSQLPFTNHLEEMGLKLERKRARNRDAARKCREKKITLISTLELELNSLEKQYEILVRQAELEEAEVNQLRNALVDHKKCGCDVSISLSNSPDAVSSTTVKVGT